MLLLLLLLLPPPHITHLLQAMRPPGVGMWPSRWKITERLSGFPRNRLLPPVIIKAPLSRQRLHRWELVPLRTCPYPSSAHERMSSPAVAWMASSTTMRPVTPLAPSL